MYSEYSGDTQGPGDIGHNPLRFAFELQIVKAQHRVAGRAEVEVAGVVGMKGDRAAVVGPEVGLDHDSLTPPEEVDRPAAELLVDLGRWDAIAVGADQSEEEGLEVAAGAIGLDSFEVVAFDLCLADGAAEEVRWEEVGGAEVFDRPWDGGDGNVVAVGGEPRG